VGTGTDRRTRRRMETIDEVLEVAVTVMAEAGAAGLSLGEVARRMGIRPPSLYEYFDSKNAIYDELFARGWRLLNESMARFEADLTRVADARQARRFVAEATVAFVRWAVEHPTYAQLMFWRPVPGFLPTPAAYLPAGESRNRVGTVLRFLVDRGWLRSDACGDEASRAYLAMISGVITQHLANEPTATFADGLHCAVLPLLIDMFFDRFSTNGGSNGDTITGGGAATDVAS
jgi:AcrR family transcriptional regulator